jgi:hypothetical protein
MRGEVRRPVGGGGEDAPPTIRVTPLMDEGGQVRRLMGGGGEDAPPTLRATPFMNEEGKFAPDGRRRRGYAFALQGECFSVKCSLFL